MDSPGQSTSRESASMHAMERGTSREQTTHAATGSSCSPAGIIGPPPAIARAAPVTGTREQTDRLQVLLSGQRLAIMHVQIRFVVYADIIWSMRRAGRAPGERAA